MLRVTNRFIRVFHFPPVYFIILVTDIVILFNMWWFRSKVLCFWVQSEPYDIAGRKGIEKCNTPFAIMKCIIGTSDTQWSFRYFCVPREHHHWQCLQNEIYYEWDQSHWIHANMENCFNCDIITTLGTLSGI